MTVIRIKRGDTWRLSWQLLGANQQPLNLAGASARLNLRDRNLVLAVEATQENGRISVDTDNAIISLAVPYAAMEIPPGIYLWDLEITFADGVRSTVDEGQLVISQDYTYG